LTRTPKLVYKYRHNPGALRIEIQAKREPCENQGWSRRCKWGRRLLFTTGIYINPGKVQSIGWSINQKTCLVNIG